MPKKGQFKKGAKKRTLRDRAYDGSSARKKARAERNRARRKAIREGRAKVGDGTVVDHKTPISKGGGKNSKTRVQSRKASDKQGGRMSAAKRKRKKK
jgi:hypothetical protein